MRIAQTAPGSLRGTRRLLIGVSSVSRAALLAAFYMACSGGEGGESPGAPIGNGGRGANTPDDMSLGGVGGLGGADTSPTGAGGSAGAGVAMTTPSGDPPPSLDELAETPADNVPWTILVYGHADHTLSNSLLTDMGEMAAAQLGGTVQLVLLADWDASQLIAGSDPPSFFPDGLQLYRISGGGAAFELLAQVPEGNLDNPAELTEIVRAVFAGLPSERRGLVLWDHGGGWEGGFGGDTQNGTLASGTPMHAQVLAEAVRAGLDAAGITEAQPLDFVAFDTCLMAGAEVAFPFRDLTSIYLAAAEIDYGAGWNYEATLTHFAQNAQASMADLAVAEVSHWDAHHASATPNDTLLRSHAALDLSQMDAFASASATLTSAMLNSETFDPLELGRSAFFALSPYSSQFEAGSSKPALRDVGQVLSALSSVQSDAGVAQAAQDARVALDAMVLASSQGSLRAGEQAGVHVEQTLGSNLTQDRLQAYRALASKWVGASRWDELLELASAASDAEPPVFEHAVVNAEAASRAAPPVLQFITEDLTTAKAAVYAALQTPENTIVQLGLVGSGLVTPNVVSDFNWDGSVIGFADGQPGMLDVWLDVAAGAQPILTIPGLIDGVSDERIRASLVFGGAEPTASVVVVTEGGTRSTMTTFEIVRAFPSATFTPLYLEYGDAPDPVLITGNPLAIPVDGFPLFLTYQPAGSYFLTTALTDIWGNEGTALDAVTLIEPLGP